MDPQAAISPEAGKPVKSRLWLGAMYLGSAIVFATAPVVYFDLGGQHGKAIGPPAFFLGVFLAFAGSFLHALCTGEIPLTKRPCRKQGGAAGYYVCLAVTGIAALLSLAVGIKLLFETLPGGGPHGDGAAIVGAVAKTIRLGHDIDDVTRVMAESGFNETGLDMIATKADTDLKMWSVGEGVLILTYSTKDKKVLGMSYFLCDERPKATRKTFHLNVREFDPKTRELKIVLPNN